MDGLTEQQLRRFDTDGYLIVENVLSDDDLAGVVAEYDEIMRRVTADLVTHGRLKPLQATTFSQRYIEALQQLEDMYLLYQHLDISLPLIEGLDDSYTLNTGPGVFGLLINQRLLDIVESVVGPEIYSNPVQHARIKPPRQYLPNARTDANIAATLWHQDSAVIDTEADHTDMLTVWLAVTDATTQNGCMIAERGSHREGMAPHCPGKHFKAEIRIPNAHINPERVVPLEVGAGGVVLLHKRTKHCSLDNNSDDIRWSFDLRYQPIGQPTGRSVFPGFVARSASHPEQVISDSTEWTRLWAQALERITSGEVKVKFSARWEHLSALPLCA